MDSSMTSNKRAKALINSCLLIMFPMYLLLTVGSCALWVNVVIVCKRMWINKTLKKYIIKLLPTKW